MTQLEFVDEINSLIELLKNKNQKSKFILIAPWEATDGDPYCPMSYYEKCSLNEQYSHALKNYCVQNNYSFIDPNPCIRSRLLKYPQTDYLVDHIHPNAGKGIKLYSEAVIKYIET